MTVDQHANVATTYGALLIGALVATLFSGMLVVQYIVYVKTYPRDTFAVKSFVHCIFILDISHTAMIWGSLWFWLIANHGTAHRLDTIPRSTASCVLVTALITLSVHLFFAWRIFRLSGKKVLLTAPVVILATIRFGIACANFGLMIKYPRFSHFRLQLPWLFSAALGLSATINVLITLELVAILKVTKAKATTLAGLVDSLIHYSVTNGAVTSFAAVLAMIVWLAVPDTFIFLSVYFSIAKLHANCVMAVFNYRTELRRARQSSQESAKTQCSLLDPNHIRPPTHHSETVFAGPVASLTSRQIQHSQTVFHTRLGTTSTLALPEPALFGSTASIKADSFIMDGDSESDG